MPVLASMSLMALSYIWSQEVVSSETLIPVACSKSAARVWPAYFDGGVLSLTPRTVLPTQLASLATLDHMFWAVGLATAAAVGTGAVGAAAFGASVGPAAGAVGCAGC